MQIKERIEAFNRENKPFYIVDHEGGRFSLCLPQDMLPDEYYPYCQEAFDAYAEEIGVSKLQLSGRHRFGDGYDWQAAFTQAFAGDPNMEKISFDCEASGFFCTCHDLAILEKYGATFREICTDTARFIPIVSQGIQRMEQLVKEQERLMPRLCKACCHGICRRDPDEEGNRIYSSTPPTFHRAKRYTRFT